VPPLSTSTWRRQAAKLARYSGVSVICTSLTVVCLAILVGLMTLSASWSNVGVVLAMTPVSFELNRRWVWGETGGKRRIRHVVPFFAFSGAGLVLSTAAVRWAAMMAEPSSQTLRTCAVIAANLMSFGVLWVAQFIVADRLIFRPAGESERVHSSFTGARCR